MQNCKEFHKDRKEITEMVENYLFLKEFCKVSQGFSQSFAKFYADLPTGRQGFADIIDLRLCQKLPS